MANIQPWNLKQVRNFYSWDIKLISQSVIISLAYRLVGDIQSLDNKKAGKYRPAFLLNNLPSLI
jgi:hypothetical protein